MFKYSKKSLERLSTIDKKLQDLFNEVIKISKIDIGISFGIRSLEEQQKVFNDRKSMCDGIIKKSKHQDGLAVDFICFVNSKLTYEIKYYYYIVGLCEEIARRLNIDVQSGIWWSFEDGGHIELK